MRTQRGLNLGVALTTLLGIGVLGFSHLNSASAQNDPAAPQSPGAGNRRFMGGGGSAIAASGDFVYVVRGGTIYQLKNTDLSLVTQKDLPAPGADGAAAAPATPAPPAPGQ